jgi:hypothetical protein
MATKVAVTAGLVVVVFAIATPAIAKPVKTTAVIKKITRTSLPGDDAYTAKGKITASEDACLNKRTVKVYQRLVFPSGDSNSLMQTVETNRKGRWKADWPLRSPDHEAAATGVHYVEVPKLKKGKLKCGFARSKEYVVPLP